MAPKVAHFMGSLKSWDGSGQFAKPSEVVPLKKRYFKFSHSQISYSFDLENVSKVLTGTL